MTVEEFNAAVENSINFSVTERLERAYSLTAIAYKFDVDNPR